MVRAVDMRILPDAPQLPEVEKGREMKRRPWDSEPTGMGCLFWLMCVFMAWVFAMTVAGLFKLATGAA